jgi:tRNA-specific 2-thiouridylase
LFRKGLFIEKSEVHWIRNDMTLGNGEQMEVMARIRYRQPKQLLCINLKTECMCLLKNINLPSEGQFAAWYIEDELVGSGVISWVLYFYD